MAKMSDRGAGDCRRGSIELIIGPMYAGKTERGMQIAREEIARGGHVEVFRPACDTRDREGVLLSHDGHEIACRSVATAYEMRVKPSCTLVWADEVQFFDAKEIVGQATYLRERGLRVILTGLDYDWMRHAFAATDELVSVADHVVVVTARCIRCGGEARFSHRTCDSTELICIGGEDRYEPLCESCWGRP